jgi:predicted transcriptional regulator
MLIRMKRLQVLIEPELDAKLARVAAAEHTSKGAVIRRLVRDGLPEPTGDWKRWRGAFAGNDLAGELVRDREAEAERDARRLR